MIINMKLEDGTNEIVIKYKIENAVKYAWVLLIMAIAMIGFGLMYIYYRYTNNSIPDFMWLDKIVKYFVWIKKKYRDQLLKKK